MSRIIAGDAKSLVLVNASGSTRPTSDRVRESLFGILDSRGWLVESASVLDLFCGTGALGLEAVSRGASSALLIDSAAGAIEVTKKNCIKLQDTLGKLAGGGRPVDLVTVRAKVAPWLRQNQHHSFDLVFADPPYELNDEDIWQQLAPLRQILSPAGLLVLERPKRRVTSGAPQWLVQEFERTWGDTEVSGYRLRSGGPT